MLNNCSLVRVSGSFCFLPQVLVGDVDADLVAKYTVLSGAYCLLRYIENCSGSNISAHSMRYV